MPPTPEEQEERGKIDRIEKEQLGWRNMLRIKGQINRETKEELRSAKQLAKLNADEQANAEAYLETAKKIQFYEKKIADAKKSGSREEGAYMKTRKTELDALKLQEQDLLRTAGGSYKAQQTQAAKKKESLQVERQLYKDINKERGFKGKVADIFRSKQSQQRQIDYARAAAGGGGNLGGGAGGTAGGGATGGAGGTGGGGGGGKKAVGAVGILAGLGTVGLIIAGIQAGLAKLSAPFKALGALAKTNLTAPLAQVSGLVSGGIGGGYGVGGGAVSGGGATSILGGLQSIASQIPFVGGLLGGLIGAFKAVADLVLGLDQGITNFARNLGISKNQAKGIKDEFRVVAKASDNIVVNETRLMESQAELTKALGVRSRFTNEALENNIKLKEIAGLELETRKALLQTSVTQNKDVNVLTKNILAQTKAFEFETGVAFEFRDILGQASKQAGVLGLIFTKNDKKLTDMVMRTKAMGFELKQLDGLASSFLDFEGSISKEMEAQVLLGKDVNLTKAREAALNNDLVGLAREITSQVGNSEQFLKLNRIQQEAIAEAVGMSRDSLADTLKQQEYYKRLGVDNLKNAQAELKALREQGLTREQISAKIGEDAYNNITNLSVAESLTELMNRIKTIFIEFVEKSGILDFITNPEKIQGFVTGLIERLAGAVNMIGSIIAGILETIGDIAGLFSSERGASLKGLASQVRAGSAAFAGGLQGAAGTISGMAAPSISSTVQAGAKTEPQPGYIPGPVAPGTSGENMTTVYVMMDGEVIAKQVAVKAPSSPYYKPGQ